jgi:DNA-binding beta-propeller fold protein YncE
MAAAPGALTAYDGGTSRENRLNKRNPATKAALIKAVYTGSIPLGLFGVVVILDGHRPSRNGAGIEYPLAERGAYPVRVYRRRLWSAAGRLKPQEDKAGMESSRQPTASATKRPRRLSLPMALAVALSLLLVVAAAAWAMGAFSSESDTAGCISQGDLGEGCQVGRGLGLAGAAAMSPDGKSLYVASQESSAVAIFDRDPASGALKQKLDTAGCVSQDGTEGFREAVKGVCQAGEGLREASDVAVSPDGKNVYATSHFPGAVAILERDRTGALKQAPGPAGCVSQNGSKGACQKGRALNQLAAVAVSPDGRNVYFASQEPGAVVTFVRDPATGALTQAPGAAGCISERLGSGCRKAVALGIPDAIAISPDGKNVYVSTVTSVTIFERDPVTGALTQKPGTTGCISDHGWGDLCQEGNALKDPEGIVVSPDGKSVYLASGTSNAVAIFDRDLATGGLTQKPGSEGCISEAGSKGGCREGKALKGAGGIAVSPDGKSVYIASFLSDAVAIFSRDPASGSLRQVPGAAGCISEFATKGCRRTGHVSLPQDVVIGPGGEDVYVIDSDALSSFDRAALDGALAPK